MLKKNNENRVTRVEEWYSSLRCGCLGVESKGEDQANMNGDGTKSLW